MGQAKSTIKPSSVTTAEEARQLTAIANQRRSDMEYNTCLNSVTVASKYGSNFTWCSGLELVIQKLKSNGFTVESPDYTEDVEVSWPGPPRDLPKALCSCPCACSNCKKN